MRKSAHRALRIWLWSVAALVFAMVVLGGTTRLTESGLSITEWKPITGVLPPLSQADWLAEFAKYKEIPQYKELFSGMSLDGFKFIFMWEWSHRLLGRLIGVVFAVPLLVFWLRGMIPAGLKPKLVGASGARRPSGLCRLVDGDVRPRASRRGRARASRDPSLSGVADLRRARLSRVVARAAPDRSAARRSRLAPFRDRHCLRHLPAALPRRARRRAARGARL